jgi:hypothetical protein
MGRYSALKSSNKSAVVSSRKFWSGLNKESSSSNTYNQVPEKWTATVTMIYQKTVPISVLAIANHGGIRGLWSP